MPEAVLEQLCQLGIAYLGALTLPDQRTGIRDQAPRQHTEQTNPHTAEIIAGHPSRQFHQFRRDNRLAIKHFQDVTVADALGRIGHLLAGDADGILAI